MPNPTNPNSQNIFATNTSFLDTDKRVLFNINWDLNAGGARQLELDAFKCVNSNVNSASGSIVVCPIDGSATKTDATLFFARSRLIKLIDVWNRILNSGLFTTCTHSGGGLFVTAKLVGSNISNILGDYPFRNMTGAFAATIDFTTVNIFNRLVRFLVAAANNHNWYLTNSVSKSSLFALTTIGSTKEFASFINTNFNPTRASFISLMNELLAIVKGLMDETKLVSKLSFNFASLDFATAQGRTNIIALNAYISNYLALAKIDLSYLNDDTKTMAQGWIDNSSTNVVRLYPQFASVISRNTESEAWSFRNVAIDTSSFNPLNVNPFIGTITKPYNPKYILCTQLDMKRPLVFETQFINWANADDRPYIMVYNSGTYIYIPDEIKDQTTLNTLGEQPDNQVNISAYFWKIGTSNGLDPHFDNEADIKLKIPDLSSIAPNFTSDDLYSIDKMDFLDNLTIYLRIN